MMIKLILLFGIFLLIAGCPSNDTHEIEARLQELETRLNDANQRIGNLVSQNSDLTRTLKKVTEKNNALETRRAKIIDAYIQSIVKQTGPCVWEFVDYQDPIPREIVSNGTADTLVAKLNKIFKRHYYPQATLIRVENETAYIRISDSERLTQQMGSGGASIYMRSILYTLFSLEPIKCVDLDFKEGDHASPGRYCPGQDPFVP